MGGGEDTNGVHANPHTRPLGLPPELVRFVDIVNYGSALQRLLQLVDYERITSSTRTRIRYDLRRMEALLHRLDDPHLATPTIHIAGTKGKGSTAAMCASVLTSQGYRTGLFSSPHLHTFRERIRLDGNPVTEEEFAALLEHVWPHMESVTDAEEYGEVTLFETLTAMAFCHFSDRADFQVLEVGLGGRLDTTNLSRPQVCAITSLSLDHTSILGNTIQQIAAEKAGIIKDGVPLVTAPQVPEAMDVITSVCRDMGAPLVKVGKDVKFTRRESGQKGQSFEVRGRLTNYELRTPLIGDYQVENAAVAVAALEILQDKGFAISRQALEKGFRDISWPCRLEVLSQDPLIVCDGAHNPYSLAKLRETLSEYLQFRRVVPIVGVSQDKKMEGMIRELVALFRTSPLFPASHLMEVTGSQTIIVTSSRHPRAARISALAEAFRQHVLTDQGLTGVNIDVIEVAGVEQALQVALDEVGRDDMVLVTGSLFVAAEAREAIYGIEPELYPELQRDHSAVHL